MAASSPSAQTRSKDSSDEQSGSSAAAPRPALTRPDPCESGGGSRGNAH